MNINLKKETMNQHQKLDDSVSLSIKGLYKKYFRNKTFSVENLSFEVKAGEFHGFIGANGAGKTTTIKSIIGAYAKFKGEIRIFGHKQSSIKGKKRIGYIPEVANFPSELNAYEYLKNMACLSGMSKKQAAKFANEKLVEVGMKEFRHRKPNQFSSGQKKKLLLAQALIGNPDLIIMDEPAANLDPMARKDFFDNLKKLQKQGKAIFISSHILVELEQYIDAVTIIDHGKLIYSGKVADVVKRDELKYVFLFRNTSSEKHFCDLVEKKNLAIEKNDNQELLVTIEKTSDVHALLEIIIKYKLEFVYVKENTKTLQNIYDEYVSRSQTQYGKNIYDDPNNKPSSNEGVK